MSIATDPAYRGRFVVHQDTDFAQEAIDRQRETDRAKYGENDLRRGAIYSVALRDK